MAWRDKKEEVKSIFSYYHICYTERNVSPAKIKKQYSNTVCKLQTLETPSIMTLIVNTYRSEEELYLSKFHDKIAKKETQHWQKMRC